MTELPGGNRRWPELPWREWEPTISTVHRWTQMVGKVRMALAPPLNHWWHVPLYVTPRGLGTSGIPYGQRQFQVDFDFVEHRLQVVDSSDRVFTMALGPKSVAEFYAEFMHGLASLGIEVEIMDRPVEVADAIAFGSDQVHASYVTSHVESLLDGLRQADRVMQAFRSGFVGKASPVQFFWGSFDLAASRYSGRPAPLHPGGSPNCPAWVMEEAYSHEEASIGWWPSSVPPGPSFYAYAYPEPDGYRAAQIRPVAAFFDHRLNEFILPYDAVRDSADPDALVLEFLQSTYEAAADLGRWDRFSLEPATLPGRPAKRPWSTVDPAGAGAAAPSGAAGTHRHAARDPG